MKVVQLSGKEYEALMFQLQQIRELLQATPRPPGKQFLTEEQLMQQYHVSKKTLQRWREHRGLAHHRIGQKLFYKVSVVEAFLEAHLLQK